MTDTCIHCGQEDGLHVDVGCPGFPSDTTYCFVITTTYDGVRRCSELRGWDVYFLNSGRANRHFAEKRGNGIYCQGHAEALALQLDTQSEREVS